MVRDARGATGIGYEGQTLEALIAGLRSLNVTTLFDVRLNAISRKRGLSKTALAAGLSDVGIAYVHLPSLGNPRDNRDGYATPHTVEGDRARDAFRDLLRSAVAVEAIDRITEAARSSRVAVLCFEADQTHCHREQVLDAVNHRLGALVSI
ncbi:MAG: DUF488 domain-containing protein [Humibacter sp.]